MTQNLIVTLFLSASGVVETGLFINMIAKAYFGNSEGKVTVKGNTSSSR